MADIYKHVNMSQDVVYIGQRPETTLDVEPKPLPLENETAHRATEDIKKEAFKQGYAAGTSAAQEQTNALHKTLNALLTSLPDVINEHRTALSAETADIVFALVQQLFINQQQNKDTITHQVTQIITQMNNKQTITVSVHPVDLALLTLDLNQFKHLRVVPDDNLRLGGCIVKSEHGVFDASIERQIDRLKHVLLEMRTT